MSELNWDDFAKLPGSPHLNFELLCRGLIHRNYQSFGNFRTLKNQPGVEFHIEIQEHCDLGDSERWWGWQCKWFDLPKDGSLGKTRRKQIEESLRKTREHVPKITDWVLCMRQTLTKKDQEWFDELRAKNNNIKLHLWAEEEIKNHLIGDASLLLETYFGALILTPNALKECLERSVDTIRARWQPEVHQVIEVERELRQMLGDNGSWDTIETLANQIRSDIDKSKTAPPVPSFFEPVKSKTFTTATALVDSLERAVKAIKNGDIDLLKEILNARPQKIEPEVATAPRRLRNGNHIVGLYITNIVASCWGAIELLSLIEKAYSSPVVAVIAPAGCGKTHLSAQLAKATEHRPAGMLLHGRDLHSNHTLDDLARRVKISGTRVENIESLFAAVNAAGERARHRLPIVIDGLNEAEDPRSWKAELAPMERLLEKYPYVVLICTIRPESRDEVLPEKTRYLEYSSADINIEDAIQLHFEHWKINAAGSFLPFFLSHPLTLRLFCEVTNPARQKMVELNTTANSLTALFDRYKQQVAERIAELSPNRHRYCEQDIQTAFEVIAGLLWEKRTRFIEQSRLRTALHDERLPWNLSLVRALEHEGVLLRTSSQGTGTHVLENSRRPVCIPLPNHLDENLYIPSNDLFAGHLIASHLLKTHTDFEAWINTTKARRLLAGDDNERHPFSDDIVYSLVEQLPRHRLKHLWQLVDEPLRDRALRYTTELEAAHLDDATVNALLDLAREGDQELLKQLWKRKAAIQHPLNAEALDRTLKPMQVADRDLVWTEWLRKNQANITKALDKLIERWRSTEILTGDQLRARYVMWILTSTVQQLRDKATRALYWFGRGSADDLFKLTIDSLSVNDAYVHERMLAASYGVVMSHQRTATLFAPKLQVFLNGLERALIGPSATAPTLHHLSRTYTRGIISFATKFCPSIRPLAFQNDWAFATPQLTAPIAEGDPRASELASTLRMDFKNYTLNKLCEHRQNYDMKHEGHKATVAYVLGVVWNLGWRVKTFDDLDRKLANDEYRSHRSRPLTERYGKKYSWIGFFTYAGLLETERQSPSDERLVDIDPSFPEQPPTEEGSDIPDLWLDRSADDDESWFCESPTPISRELVIRDTIGGHRGPWVLVHGFLKAEDKVLGRTAWSSIAALIIDKTSIDEIVSALNEGARPWTTSEPPSDYYMFAGEFPWHPELTNGSPENTSEDNAYLAVLKRREKAIVVETLAHRYLWEKHYDDISHADNARIPPPHFSSQFDLRSAPQTFDQFLPDGTKASVTLSGVDGLDGEALYLRQDLLEKYVDERELVLFAFGERELWPYSLSPPEWQRVALQQGKNAWQEIDTNVLSKPSVSKKTT